MNENAPRSEIIIIKRGGEGDEDHHGGAWKIAFADFMTAMMALFLVLWLINAANEETKKSVASYFNPVKLVDRNRSTKGLLDAAGPQESTENEDDEATAAAKAPEKARETEARPTDADLQKNPYGVLAKIAARPPGTESPAAKKNVSPGNTGQSSGSGEGETFRDPFDPDFWQTEMTRTAPGAVDTEPAAQAESVNDDKAGEQDVATRTASTVIEEPSSETPEPKMESKEERKEASKAEGSARGNDQEAARLRNEVDKALGSVKDIDPALASSVKVVADKDGVLISLTDELVTPMFEIGSAVPSRDMVLAMEQLAKVLSREQGRLRVYGHTDARPYRTRDYDNWQLSVARAQSAYFMLVRGGIAQERLAQVSGFADSRLSNKDDPQSGANRRIEILLEAAQ
jgi:chemotaxis protein MotB